MSTFKSMPNSSANQQFLQNIQNYSKTNRVNQEGLVKYLENRILGILQNAYDLKGVTFQEILGDRQSSGNYFTIFINQDEARHPRDEVYRHLKEHEIQAKKYFFPALHRQKVYEKLGMPYRGKLPVTEEAAVSGLALPMFSHITENMLLKVIESVREILQ